MVATGNAISIWTVIKACAELRMSNPNKNNPKRMQHDACVKRSCYICLAHHILFLAILEYLDWYLFSNYVMEWNHTIFYCLVFHYNRANLLSLYLKTRLIIPALIYFFLNMYNGAIAKLIHQYFRLKIVFYKYKELNKFKEFGLTTYHYREICGTLFDSESSILILHIWIYIINE